MFENFLSYYHKDSEIHFYVNKFYTTVKNISNNCKDFDSIQFNIENNTFISRISQIQSNQPNNEFNYNSNNNFNHSQRDDELYQNQEDQNNNENINHSNNNFDQAQGTDDIDSNQMQNNQSNNEFSNNSNSNFNQLSNNLHHDENNSRSVGCIGNYYINNSFQADQDDDSNEDNDGLIENNNNSSEDDDNSSENDNSNVDDDELNNDLSDENDNLSNERSSIKHNFKSYKSVKIDIEKFIGHDIDKAPKVFLNTKENIYLTRLYEDVNNTKTNKMLLEKGALGYVTSTSDGSHRTYRCSVFLNYKEEQYQCTVAKRAKDIDYVINHNEHKFDINDKSQTVLNIPKAIKLSAAKGTPELIFNDLAFLVACETLSLNRVNCRNILNLITDSIEIGQKNPNTPSNQLLPLITKEKIRRRIIDLACCFKEKATMQHSAFTHHGMAIDSGSVNSFHFIDICLIIPSLSIYSQSNPLINPYNFATFLIDNSNVETIQNKVLTAINDLKKSNIRITSITCDNILTQILAFAPWSKISLMRNDNINDPSLKRIIFCSCASHTLNLIAKSISEQKAPTFIKDIYSSFVKATDCLDKIRLEFLEKPPKNIKTRWLLMLNQIKYLRLHDIFFIGYSNINYPTKTTQFLLDTEEYDDFNGVDFSQHPKYSGLHKEFIKLSKKQKINIELFSLDNYRNFMILGRVLWPLWQGILFFEKNNSTIMSIFPIFEQILSYWEELKSNLSSKVSDSNSYDADKWIETISYLQDQLTFRKFHTMDWPLITLAYTLTPAGRLVYQNELKI